MPKKGWRQSLQPRIHAARAELTRHDPPDLARRGGLIFSEDRLELSLLGTTYHIRAPELVVTSAEGTPCPEELQILVLDYLVRGDGTTPTGRWVGFQELPDRKSVV